MGRVFLLGDIHGSPIPVIDFVDSHPEMNITTDDVIVLLGDTGLNFFLDERDDELKEVLSKRNITIFAIRGNHDCRITTAIHRKPNRYFEKIKITGTICGTVWRERRYPNIVYALDEGGIYKINGHTACVIPGAFSVDRPFREAHNLIWYEDEQLTIKELDNLYRLAEFAKPEIILSHTTAALLAPTDLFLHSIDQSKVDHTMENYLDKFYTTIPYRLWCWGHYHRTKDYGLTPETDVPTSDNPRNIMLYEYVIELEQALSNETVFLF